MFISMLKIIYQPSLFSVFVAATMALGAAGAHAKTLASPTDIDRAVISKVSSLYRINSKVIEHLDLTKPFSTKSQWTLVITKQPDEESADQDGAGNPVGAVSICFVNHAGPECSEALFLAKYREHNIKLSSGEMPFYELFTSDVVYSGPGKTLPLLRIKTCTMHSADGDCGKSTFLFAYDRASDKFRAIFFNMKHTNNNQETRFIENGPLLGDVIVAYPTSNAPFGYYVEVYKRNAQGKYTRILKYRGKTGYGDGNPLAVIDSQMPETLRRLGFWKPGDALPVPPTMPSGCSRLVMHKGVEWCEPNNT